MGLLSYQRSVRSIIVKMHSIECMHLIDANAQEIDKFSFPRWHSPIPHGIFQSNKKKKQKQKQNKKHLIEVQQRHLFLFLSLV